VSKTVECATHGEQALAYVCHHTFQSLYDGIGRGLFCWTDEGVNAYCDQCAERLEAHGGECTDEFMEFFNGKVLCIQCFERVKQINRRVM